jgi:two-component system sensor histidine kinase PhoQ
MRTDSLRLRFLLGAGTLLMLFVILTGLALTTALDRYSEQAEKQRLQGLVFALLAAAEVQPDGSLNVNDTTLPEPRLQQPDSGLSATIFDHKRQALWQSASTLSPATLNSPPAPGEWNFTTSGAYQLNFGFEWELTDNSLHRFAVQVTENDSPIAGQRRVFAQRLWWWLLGISTVLIALLLMLLRWGLRPLQGVAQELESVRAGEQSQLNSRVPLEIEPLTRSINTLLLHEHQQQQRYRHALDDLAHSLKTPLAVMQGQTEHPQPAVIREQVGRMNQIISHQLQRAATIGRQALRQPLLVSPVVDRLTRALQKVYAEKNLHYRNRVPVDFQLGIDEADLMEMLGNLLDNAAKFAQTEIVISAMTGTNEQTLSVCDDGPGIPPDQREHILERGMRADSRHPGQGIGLAVVRDIISSYHGELIIAGSDTGGACLMITCPHES